MTTETRQLTQYRITLWTLTDLRSCYVPEGPPKVAVQYTCRHLGLYCIYVHERQSIWNPNSSTLEPDRPQHDRLAASVIAQQYSSAIAASLRSHCRNEK